MYGYKIRRSPLSEKKSILYEIKNFTQFNYIFYQEEKPKKKKLCVTYGWFGVDLGKQP